jgi:WD40 repeat protein
MKFLPDGKRLAVSTWKEPTERFGNTVLDQVNARKREALIQVIDVDGGKRLTVPCTRRYTYYSASLAISPDGRLLAFLDENHDPCLWDFANSKTVVPLPSPPKDMGQCAALAFSTNGRQLAVALGGWSATDEAPITLYDVTSRKIVGTLKGHIEDVISLAYSPDGAALFSAGADRSFRVWDVAKRQQTQVLELADKVHAYTPDGRVVVVDGNSNFFEVWDVRGAKKSHQVGISGFLGPCTFSPDGKKFALLQNDGRLEFWNTDTWETIDLGPGHHADVRDLAFTPDGRTLATIGADSSIRLWDVARSLERRVIKLPSAGGRESWQGGRLLTVSADGSTLTAISGDQFDSKVRQWRISDGRLLAEWQPSTQFPQSLGLSAAGDSLAVGANSGVSFSSIPNGKPLGSIEPSPTALDGKFLVFGRYAAFSPDGCLFAVGVTVGWPEGFPSPELARTYCIQVFDAASRRRLCEIPADRSSAGNLIFSPDGRVLATGGAGPGSGPDDWQRSSIWETATGAPLGHVADLDTADHKTTIHNLAFSPDGRLLATTESLSETVHVWNVRTGKELTHFAGGHGTSGRLAFSPDGKLLAVGGSSGNTILWDVSTLDHGLGPKPPAKDLARFWKTLAAKEGEGVLQAVYSLAAARDDAVALIRAEVRPAVPLDGKRLARLLTDLDDDSFPVREAAAAELAKLGDAADAPLRKALAGPGSAAFKKQVKRLLDTPEIQPPSTEELRALRSVWVLEEIASPEAKKCLKVLANGAEGRRLTTAAQHALTRIH